MNFKCALQTLQNAFSKQIINVDKRILRVGPGLRLAHKFNIWVTGKLHLDDLIAVHESPAVSCNFQTDHSSTL